MFQFINSNPNICTCIFILGICYLTFLRREVEHFAFVGSLIKKAIMAVMSPLINYVKNLIMRIFGKVAKFAGGAMKKLARGVGKTVYTGIMQIISIIKQTANVVIGKVKKIIKPYWKPVAIVLGIFLSWGLVMVWFLILEPIVYPPKLEIPDAPKTPDIPTL